jgi:hypothetical protein
MNNELKDVYLTQGEGHWAMSLNEATIEMMSAIRKENPDKWENRDLDLLEEAVKRLKEDKM